MKKTFLLLLCSCTFLFFACSKKSTTISSKPLVIVSVSPYETFVRKIAGDTLEVKAAVPANFNAHLFEATPHQIQGFERASVWFGIGEPFEKNLVQSLKSYNKNLIAVDLSHLHGLSNYTHEHSHGSCSHSHHHDEGLDRHFYSSPKLALEQSRIILNALVKLYPENKDLYQANFLKLEREFEELIDSIAELLDSSKGKAIILSHPALGYFCQDYHLIQLALECEGKTPLPEDLTKTLSLSKSHPVLCVFGLEQFDNKGALAISEHLKLPLYIINVNNPDYFKNMKHIASLIVAQNNHE
jgi:zinc transport system substrate-binding protein